MAWCPDCDNGRRYCRNDCQAGKAYCPSHSGAYCKICGGSGLVTCSYCKGRGLEQCETCGGKGYFPDDPTPEPQNRRDSFDDDPTPEPYDRRGNFDYPDEGHSNEYQVNESQRYYNSGHGGEVSTDSGSTSSEESSDTGSVVTGGGYAAAMIAIPLHLYLTWHFTNWVMPTGILATEGLPLTILTILFYSVVPGALWYTVLVLALGSVLNGGEGAARWTGAVLKLGLATVWGVGGHSWLHSSPLIGAIVGALAGVLVGAICNRPVGGLARGGAGDTVLALIIALLIVLWAAFATAN